MKKYFVYLVLCLFSAWNGFAQVDTAANKNAPVIKFSTMEYDFGTIKQNGPGTCEYIVTNEGKVDLVISNVQKGCGCTNTDWSKEPIKPGKTGWVKATYNTAIVGPFSKGVTVFSNSTTPTVGLKFKGTVEAVTTPPAPPAPPVPTEKK